LRLASYFGFSLTAISVLVAVGYFIAYLFNASSWTPGFATLVLLNLLSLGILSLFVGVLGEYFSQIYDQLKKSPMPIIETQRPDPARNDKT